MSADQPVQVVYYGFVSVYLWFHYFTTSLFNYIATVQSPVRKLMTIGEQYTQQNSPWHSFYSETSFHKHAMQQR